MAFNIPHCSCHSCFEKCFIKHFKKIPLHDNFFKYCLQALILTEFCNHMFKLNNIVHLFHLLLISFIVNNTVICGITYKSNNNYNNNNLRTYYSVAFQMMSAVLEQ